MAMGVPATTFHSGWVSTWHNVNGEMRYTKVLITTTERIVLSLSSINENGDRVLPTTEEISEVVGFFGDDTHSTIENNVVYFFPESVSVKPHSFPEVVN